MFGRIKLLGYFRQRDRGWLLSLFVLVCMAYVPFFGNPFVFDDLPFFKGWETTNGRLGLDFQLRWLPYSSLSLTAALSSDVVPHFFRLGNLLLHAANAVLLFNLLRMIVGAVQPESRDSSELLRGAWFAALIFALHPVAVYAVGYVVQRSILMATLFVLLMQIAYLRGLLSGQARWLALAVLCYFLAVFSKEHSVLSPAVLGALTLLLRNKNVVSKRALWLTWGAFLAVAIVVTLRARGVLADPYEAMATAVFEQQGIAASSTSVPMLHVLSAMTQAGLFFKYLLLWLLPNVTWMSIDMREPFVASPEAWQGWLGVSAFVAYGVAAAWLLTRGGTRGLIGLALLYPWLQFGVELVAIRVQEPFVLYRSYLWMPGLMLLLPVSLMRFPQRKTLLAFACVSILLIPLAWNRLWVFSDNYRLWNDAALLLKDGRTAGADRIYFNRGQALMVEQKWDEAAKDFERTIAISPQLGPPYLLLGEVHIKDGRYSEALGPLDKAIALKTDDVWAYFYKGVALKRLHRNEEARKPLEQSCELNNFAACLLISLPQQNKH